MRYAYLLLLILATCSASSQTLTQKLESAYSRFEQDDQLRFASVSLSVMNAKTGEFVFSRNGDMGLASASTLKTVTAATAFHLLGKNFTWTTTFGYTGKINNGTLEGNLVILGGADPTLGSDRYDETKPGVILKKWVNALQAAGIKKVTGLLISDDRLLGTQTLPGGWTWQDMGNYYGAGPSALTWRENQFDLIFRAGKVSDPAALLKTEPQLTGVKIVNEVITGASGTGDNVYAYSAPFSELIYVRGSYGLDLNKKIGGSIPDPALQLASELSAELLKAGISIDGGYSTARILNMEKRTFSSDLTPLDRHVSPELEKVVYWFNQKSINLYGEHLLASIALKHGEEGSTREGVRVMTSFWNKRLGINTNELNLYDGSGLSPANRITTSAMAEILCSIQDQPWYTDFYKSLPEYNNMKMKSGSISDVLGYAGYHKSSSGTPFVFSILVNNYSGSSSAMKQKMFRLLDTMK